MARARKRYELQEGDIELTIKELRLLVRDRALTAYIDQRIERTLGLIRNAPEKAQEPAGGPEVLSE